MINKSPAFNLKAVLRETGLAADTLRAWERRYGLPKPQRTGGGHRLYSQYDIETVKWLMEKQNEGLSISRAVDLWNEISASGTDPLADSRPLGLVSAPLSTPTTTLDAIRTEWIANCLVFDEAKAEQTLNNAFSMFPVESVCFEVLQKGMSEIGGYWYNNRVTVQQEHFASGLAMRRLNSLMSASALPSRRETIVIGCPPGEWHTFTPSLLTLLLRRRGFNVIYLGASLPIEQFSETALKVKANLVILVAQTLISAASLQHIMADLSSNGIKTAFGGRIFNLRPSIIEYIAGDYLGNSIESAIQEVEKLLTNKSTEKQTKITHQDYFIALKKFNGNRIAIENTFSQGLVDISAKPEELINGITFLGDNISAALQFGDMEHASPEVDWLKILLKTHSYSHKELSDFMKKYAFAVNEHINEQGKPIKNWLQNFSEI